MITVVNLKLKICLKISIKNTLSKKMKLEKEKIKDKISAESGEKHVFTCNLMAVQLLPYCQANSIYYKMKLANHNYTVYNIGNHDTICYWSN